MCLWLLKWAVALAIGAATASALDPSRLVSQYTLRTWSQAQGLPQDSVRALAQTRDGYLWVGTDEGLARFDGYSFIPVAQGDLPSIAVRALLAASNGTVWIGTASGLARYDGGHVELVREVGTLPVTAITEAPGGAVWISAGMRLFRYASGAFANYGPENGLRVEGIRAILPLGPDEVAVAGYGAVGLFQHGETNVVSSTRNMSGSVPTSLLRTKQGTLLAGGTKGLFVGSPAGRWDRLEEFGGLVRALASDRDGNIWVGTNSGLVRWQPGAGTRVSRMERFAADWIWCLFEDREGSLWAGTNNGLYQLVDQPVAVFGRDEGMPSDEPVGVAQDGQGRIWTGFHNGGLGYFDHGQFLRVLPREEVLSIRSTKDGEILAGTRSGLYRISDRRVAWSWRPSDPLGRANVFDVVEDGSGTLWLGTNGGLLRLRGDAATVAAPGGTLLDDAVVAVLAARDGTIWGGTYSNGLWRIGRSERVRFTTASGLPNDQIRALYEDPDGVIWIATFGGGLAFYRAGAFTAVTAGLPSSNIGSIVGDGGYLWIGTTRGIVRVERDSLVRKLVKSLQLIGADEGLRSANAAPGYPTASGGTRSKTGEIWFPTARGLAKLRAGPTRSSATLPVHVSEITADAVPWDPAMEMPPDIRRIEIRYAAVHLSAPDAVRYRFRLEPYDRDWNEAGSRRVAAYSNLRSGSYRFRVVAALAGTGQWVETAPLTFRKRPWFYETWWFASLAVASVALLLWSGWRRRLGQERRRFALLLEERSRMARELHDTLAQGYVGIASQLGSVKPLVKSNPEMAAEQIELARRMAQHSLTEARRSIADLRSSTCDTGNFEEALRASLTGLVQAPISYEVDHVPRPLPPETAHHLLRIAQEAVTNAAKHGRASHIRVRLHEADGRMHLEVTDDGVGFDVTNGVRPGHFGLLGIRERAEAIGGTVKLRSHPGQGTTVEVECAT